MDHLRVATYEVIEGTPADIMEIVQQPDGVIEVYKGMPGFKAYSLLEISPTEIMSVTAWETHAEAEEAIAAAAEWVATHIAGRLKRTFNTTASPLIWVGTIG